MTDPEIIRTLAEREGFIRLDESKWYAKRGAPNITRMECEFFYLTSLDALKPVLAVMTDMEKLKVIAILEDRFTPDEDTIDYDGFGIFLLTLPPRTLAEAVAKSLKGC